MVKQSTYWKKVKGTQICLLLFFLFSVQFSFLPLNTGRLVLLYCLIVLVTAFKGKLEFPYKKATIGAFIILILYAIYTTFITLLSKGENLANFYNVILILLQIGLTAYLIAVYFIKTSLNQFLFTLLIIFSVQGVLIFINFISLEYREFMFRIMPLGGNITEDNFTSAFRTRGIMQSSGATVSSFLALGLPISVYFLTSFNLSKVDRYIIVASLPCILIGIMFTGRTGFVMIPLTLLLYYALRIINRCFSYKDLLLILYLPMIAIVVYVVFKEIYIQISPNTADILRLWESWAFDQVIANFSNSGPTKSTLEQLQSFVFLPSNDMQLLFGDPTSWGIVRTDLGYIRMIYSVGILGSLLFYGGFIQIFLYIVKHSRLLTQRVLLVSIFFWLFIIEYKEPMFLHNYFVSFNMLLVFYTMMGIPDDKSSSLPNCKDE